MNEEIVTFDEVMTYERFKKGLDKLLNKDKPKVYHHPIVFLSDGDFKMLDYLATKYPKGAKEIKKIDKKFFKKQSLKNKRYYIKQEIPPVEKVIVYEQEALRFSGMN
jgi:hypothetical protein